MNHFSSQREHIKIHLQGFTHQNPEQVQNTESIAVQCISIVVFAQVAYCFVSPVCADVGAVVAAGGRCKMAVTL